MLKSNEDLKKIIQGEKLFIAGERGKENKLREQLDKNKLRLDELNLNLELLAKVNLLFQRTSEYARNQAKDQVESLVTKCLQFVFEEEISFEIEIEELRGRPSAKFYVVSQIDGKELRLEPEHSKGGGVIDVVSLALRIAFLETHRPKILGPLILDEPAKHVSSEYIYNVSDFLKQNADLFTRQIIMVTHDDFLASIGDKSYTIKLEDGVSVVGESPE